MSSLSIIIPIGNYHREIASRAIASAQAQTLPCDIIPIYDYTEKGAGWARNQGLAKANGTHIAFLDADDTIDPYFAEICLGVLAQHQASGRGDLRYAYTDWFGENNVVHQAPLPCDAWVKGAMSFHLVTSVMPTDAARRIGGFDENMQGLEDSDFYMRLRLSGFCGAHIERPLVHYREGGQRSIAARASGQEALALQYLSNRYGGMNFMGCCGDNQQHPNTPGNEPQAGDILAQALWGGNRQQIGLATGRLYPRTASPKLLYVAKADVEAAPHHWKAVTSPIEASNGVILQPAYQPSNNASDWQNMAQVLANAMFAPAAPPPEQGSMVEYKPNNPALKKNDVLAKARGK